MNLVSVWEESIARPLRALHLGSIRNQILVFAVLATLIPTLATTLGSYGQARRSLTDKIAQDLRSASSEAARGTDLWLDARLHDLREAARSYVVSENLARSQGRDPSQALGRLRDYLNSVRQRFPDLEALLVIDASGRVVTNSTGRTGVRLPPDALNGLRAGDPYLGDAYWDAGVGKAAIVLAVPIREADGRLLAAFTAKVSLRAVAEILQRLSPHEPGDVYLMTEQGRMIIRARASSADLMRTRLPDTATRGLVDREGQTAAYRRAGGQEVVAALQRVPQVRWAAVELPAGGVGEAGHFTRSFNTLLGRLRERESAGELERLSVTDALTGLYNRRHLMGTLASEAQRARRLRRPFSVLLMDVDHFKQYNDTHGHLAGDAALTKMAEILRQQTRAVDCVARYGGEEFLVVLLETTVATAALVAERIRNRVATEAFGGGRMTVSIGVAECPAHGDTPESLIASADAAMYEAKGGGRDRVMAARGKPEGEKEKKRRRKGEAS